MSRHYNGWYQQMSPCDKMTTTFTVTAPAVSHLTRVLIDVHTGRDGEAYSRTTVDTRWPPRALGYLTTFLRFLIQCLHGDSRHTDGDAELESSSGQQQHLQANRNGLWEGGREEQSNECHWLGAWPKCSIPLMATCFPSWASFLGSPKGS